MAINRRFTPGGRETGKRLRINEAIRTSPVRLIDDNNEQIGVIDVTEAKRRAKEAGLDLVEVSPQSSPPVCRIMDYGKWKYSQKKKDQKARSHSKQSELKEVRLRPQIDPHDLEIKTNRSRGFLEEGHKVQFTIQFKGREMAHRELGMDLMREVAKSLDDVSRVEAAPRNMGRRMTMILIPERKSAAAGTKPGAQPGKGDGAGPAGQPAPRPGTPPGPAAAAKPPAPAAPAAPAKPAGILAGSGVTVGAGGAVTKNG
jgi:translation initiation factor IF-3